LETLARKARLEEVRRILDGGDAEWRVFVGQYRPLLAGIFRRILQRRGLHQDPELVAEHAEEFYSELFLRRATALGGYRADGPLKAYLAVLAANHLRRAIEARAREQRNLARLPVPSACEETHPSQDAEEVAVALARCSPEERLLYQLLYVDDLAPHEAARFLGVSREVLYLRKHRFLRKLRDLIVPREPIQERSAVRGDSP